MLYQNYMSIQFENLFIIVLKSVFSFFKLQEYDTDARGPTFFMWIG